jgi:hypothetical protein
MLVLRSRRINFDRSSQQKIPERELAFPRRDGAAARAASGLARDHRCACFFSDNAVQRVAMRTIKMDLHKRSPATLPLKIEGL